MSVRDVLTAIFDVETPYDDPCEAADLMLRRLGENGLAVVPREATAAIKRAWREAHRAGLNGPVAQWAALVEAA